MVKIIVGMMGSSVARGSNSMANSAQVDNFLSVLTKFKVNEIDTARVYNSGKSEELLGSINAGKSFAISTKIPAFQGGSLTAAKVSAACNDSLKALNLDQVDILYFHGPDRKTKLEESCEAINSLYKEGKLRRFGVSNLRVDEVQEIYDICKEKGYILPTVYQGGFNPLLRSAEEPLFPTLRRLGIAFYAYSPLGGGFFSKHVNELINPTVGTRMEAMKVFQQIYVNEKSLVLLQKLTAICETSGIEVKEATLRWFMHHSVLTDSDGVILGASSAQQAEENLKACFGERLPDAIVECFEDMWTSYKPNASTYCV